MTDDTRPTSTDTGAGTFQEARFRADYLHSMACYPDDPAEYDPADSLDAAEYASPWMNSGDWQERDWVAEWVYLGEASERWQRDRTAAAAHAAKHADELTAVQRRSEEQARDLAEHGITYDEHGLVSGPYIEAVEQRGALAHAPHDVYLYRYADRVPGDEEVLMRADYDRVQDFRAWTQGRTRPSWGVDRAAGIEAQWTGRGDELSEAWRHLDGVRLCWEQYPAQSQLALTEHEARAARGESGRFTGMQWRNQLHARALTGNGKWTVDATDRERDVASAAEHDQLPDSALADYRSGNALATGLANERKGLRR
ncbi:hypothetical protein [Nocardia sp. NPDC057353]|uniref:hypothetical protein n=1 Tax=Nocardia sp. NPDC057353 TaxID=3346104 RepID=UPI0036423D0D